MDRLYKQYYEEVFIDIEELRNEYPFVSVTLLPTAKPSTVKLKVVAVNKYIVAETGATQQDFTDDYDRSIEIEVPFDYKKNGCKVYGGKWIKVNELREADRHFNGMSEDGRYLFCIGIPASFTELDNVILENVRTAEKMLTAYKLLDTGRTENLELLSYSHGIKGKEEYERREAKRKGNRKK